MNNYTYNNIESSRREYGALPADEWRKDYFNEENGGYLVTHWKRIEEANRNRKEKIRFVTLSQKWYAKTFMVIISFQGNT